MSLIRKWLFPMTLFTSGMAGATPVTLSKDTFIGGQFYVAGSVVDSSLLASSTDGYSPSLGKIGAINGTNISDALTAATSAAPAATTPTGSEMIPCVQGGVTSRCTAANLANTAARVRSIQKVCWDGDSQFAYALNQAANVYQFTGTSIVNWARWQGMGRFYTDPSLVFAVAGTKTDALAGRVAAEIAAGCTTVVDDMGTNNVGTYTAAQTTTDLKAYWSALNAAGISVIEEAIPPQASWSLTNRQIADEVNGQKYLASLDKTRNVRFVDIRTALIDYSTGFVNTAYLYSDGVHINPQGAAAAAPLVVAAINSNAADNAPLPISAAAQYDATLNPTGSLLASYGGMLSGTGGSLTSSPTGATGTVATGWNCGFATSGGSTTETAACAKGTDATNTTIPTQTMTFGGTGDSNYFRLSTTGTIPVAGINPGDTVYGRCVVSYTGMTNMKSLQLLMRVYDNGVLNQSVDGAEFHPAATSAVALPASSGGKLLMTTRPYTIGTSLTFTSLYVEGFPLTAGGALGGTVTVQQCGIYRAPTITSSGTSTTPIIASAAGALDFSAAANSAFAL